MPHPLLFYFTKFPFKFTQVTNANSVPPGPLVQWKQLCNGSRWGSFFEQQKLKNTAFKRPRTKHSKKHYASNRLTSWESVAMLPRHSGQRQPSPPIASTIEMHAKQNRCPHGVNVACSTASKHTGHVFGSGTDATRVSDCTRRLLRPRRSPRPTAIVSCETKPTSSSHARSMTSTTRISGAAAEAAAVVPTTGSSTGCMG